MDDWPVDHDAICELCGNKDSITKMREGIEGGKAYHCICIDKDACRRRKESSK